MTPPPDGQDHGPQTLTQRLFSAVGADNFEQRDPQEVVPASERKAAMSTLDRTEFKFAFGGLLLGTLAGIIIPLYIVSQNRVDKHGKNSIAVAPDALLLMAAILLFCVLGFFALWKKKRTLVAFSLFLIGFGFTLFIGIAGFVFILLGGWLMLRAWRLNKYGSTNAKVVAREAAASRPARGKNRSTGKEKVSGSVKSSATTGKKPPTANKRYTPKGPTRKKIPKPTE